MSIKQFARPEANMAKRRKLSSSPIDSVSPNEDGILEAETGNEGASSYSEDDDDDDDGGDESSETEETGSKSANTQSLKRKTSNSNENFPAQDLPIIGANKTSALAIQVDDLIRELNTVRVKQGKGHDLLVNQVIREIRNVPARPAGFFSEVENSLKKGDHVNVPWTKRPGADTKYTFAYAQPTQISSRTVTTSSTTSDRSFQAEIAVEMPELLFQEKDYLNNRALHKRSFYLACLAAGLTRALKGDLEARFAYKDDITLTPILLLTTKNRKPTFVIEVTPVFPSSLGPIDRMTPLRNCVRPANSGDGDDKSGTSLEPTPFYNSTVRALSFQMALNLLLQTVSRKCDAFENSCLLGLSWLQQRGLGSSQNLGGFGEREWSTMCALLLTSGGYRGLPLFSDRYSTIQLFKAMLQVITTKDFSEGFAVRGTGPKKLPNKQPLFYDCESGVNILYKMTPWSYQRLKHYASISLMALNSRQLNSFDSTFILRLAEDSLEFDEVYVIDLRGVQADSMADRQIVLGQLHEVLMKGLTDRVSLIDLSYPSCSSWDPAKSSMSTRIDQVEVKLIANADNVARLIDHGPTADEVEKAKDFRGFWGPKSELRRFKDGSINETLVWSDKAPVTGQVIRHLATRHFGLKPTAVVYKHRHLEATELSSNDLLSAADAFQLVSKKFQTLSSTLHQMEGLPLPIRSVVPACAALRSASTSHPLQTSSAGVFDILVQFDSSTKWPDALPAIQYTKIAFLTKLSELLVENDSDLSTRVGIENSEGSATTGYFNTSFLDIISPSPGPSLAPIIFRLRIHHEREQHLLQAILNDKSNRGIVRDQLQHALQANKRLNLAGPAHTTAVRNLITQFQPLSATIRLLKQWFSSHRLLNHIAPEVLEILSAYVFLPQSATAWSRPGSATTAFLRILHFLSRWDWTSEPMIVDLSMSQDAAAFEKSKSEMTARFQAWRKLDPNMNNVTWFVGSNLDATGTIWTQSLSASSLSSSSSSSSPAPPRVVAGRITALAHAAIDLIKTQNAALSKSMDESDWQSLFVSPLTDFDFVIYLRSSSGKKKKSHGKTGTFKNFEVSESIDLDIERVGFDPVVLYLHDLERVFSNVALFMSDRHAGGVSARDGSDSVAAGSGRKGDVVIAGLWRPQTQGVKEWRVRLGYSSIPISSEGKDEKEEAKAKVLQKSENGDETKGSCMINKDGILAEMAILGEGLVERIEIVSK